MEAMMSETSRAPLAVAQSMDPIISKPVQLELINRKFNPVIGLLRSVLQLFTTIIWKLMIIFANSSFRSTRLRLPPGPRGWPVLGCLFQLRRSLISGNFEEMVDEFGPIITLQVVSTPVIIITDAKIAHEAFIEKGSLFASRPRTSSSTDIISANLTTVSSSVYGPVWRALRRNLVNALVHSSSKASYLRHLREEVVEDVLRRFRDDAAAALAHDHQNAGGIVQVRPIIKYGFFNLLSSFCFGRQLQESVVADIAQVINQILLLRSSIGIVEFLPWLKFIPWMGQSTKRERELRQQLKTIFLPFIKDAQDLNRDGKLPHGSYMQSLLAVHLQEEDKLSNDELVDLCTEIIVAGSDTTVATLEWAIANVIIHPTVQAQIVNEIENVVGKRVVKEEDIHKLPYLEAVVLETLRRHPPGYYTLPHAVTEPCKLQGYDIPVNAKVYASIWSISNDPRVWEDPTAFKPERFLIAGSDNFDMTGSKSITMIPFGAGRRICPGLGLAMLNLGFLLARLVQSFEWTPKPNEDIDLTIARNFTMVMKTPVTALISERSSSNEDII